MAKLIGNYTIPSNERAEPCKLPDNVEATPKNTAAEFERRAMERLGGSIAFVMKGKTVVWSGSGGPGNRTNIE